MGDCGRGDVVDVGEGGEEEDGCWVVGLGVVVSGWEGEIGGGQHEFLFNAAGQFGLNDWGMGALVPRCSVRFYNL